MQPGDVRFQQSRQSPRGGPVTDETRRGGFGGFVGWGSLSPFRCPPVPLSLPFPFRRPIRCPFGQQKRQCFDFARDSKRDLVVPAKSATLPSENISAISPRPELATRKRSAGSTGSWRRIRGRAPNSRSCLSRQWSSQRREAPPEFRPQ